MNLGSHLRRSLKTRVTLFTLAIFLVGIWSLAFYASRMLREDMQRLLGEQQFSTATIVAAQVNDELVTRLRALKEVAETITPAMINNPATLHTILKGRVTFLSLFNNGVAVAGPDGTAISDAPLLAGRIGANFMDRDYIVGALKEGKATIGRPVASKVSKNPTFVMAAPIRDDQGKVIGALAGVTDLGKPNFLDKITEGRYGKTGGYILIAAQHRLIVTASDKSRIMQPLSAPGILPQTDRFIEGFEGYAVYVNPRGEEVLNSSKRIPAAGWNMAVTIPTAEAFAPIRAMQWRMLMATIFLTLLAGGLTWWMLKRQLAPMFASVKTLAALADTDQPPQSLPIARHDEIGELIGGFNRLLEALAQREKAVKESERKLSVILESVEAYIYLKDTQGRYLFANRPMRELFGVSIEEIVGQSDENFFDAATIARIRINDRQVLDEGKTLKTEETNVSLKDGHTSTFLSVKLPLRNEAGAIYALCGISTDITERKQMEEQVRQLAFYDQLTHLPNRRLLEDRLGQTMAASKRTGCYGALMFLDLDHFKPLNDLYGHAVGDLLLIQVAARLKSCVRAMDTVARFGGDEFVVMISELDVDRSESIAQAGIIAEKIRAALAEPYQLNIPREGKTEAANAHHCTTSIGVALFAKHEVSQDDVLKWADTAMYQAKEVGRNSIRFHDSTA